MDTSTNGTAELGRHPDMSSVEQVEGTVESVTATGIRVGGCWYEYTDWPAQQRPAVGDRVRIVYRVDRRVQTVTRLAGAPARAGRQSAAPSGTRDASAATGTRAANGRSSERAPAAVKRDSLPAGRVPVRPDARRNTITGVVAAYNERGIKVGELWYNYSRLTPIPEAVRARITRGASVILTIESGQWLTDVQLVEGPTGPASVETEASGGKEGWDERYL